MKLNYDKKSKNPTYFGQISFRIGNKSTTKNLIRIGKHDELLKDHDDPLQYAMDFVKNWNEEQKKNNKMTVPVNIRFDTKLPRNNGVAVPPSKLYNVGYFFLQKIYQQLDISGFFKSVEADKKITFDSNLINRFLVISRILWPDSKLGMWEHKNQFYEQPSFEYQHILRMMDILANHFDDYLEYLYTQSDKVCKRDTSVLYYDCTNFYNEVEMEDEDIFDEVTGELIRPGLRKYGPSKEHRPNPIVQMGLFIDRNGIPLTMDINSGSTNEQTTAIPLEKKILKMVKEKDIIYCSDGGLGSSHIRLFNSMQGRNFIVTQSIKKLSNVLQQAVFNDYEYKLLSCNKPVTIKYMKEFDRTDTDNLALYNDTAYKVIPADTLVDIGLTEEKTCRNGNVKVVKSKAELKQNVIVTFSRKMMEYQRSVRNRQIERAKALLRKSDPDEIKKGPNDVRRFIRKQNKTKDTYVLDEDRIREEEKYDGYYAIATNLNWSVKEIMKVQSKRNDIENCFRVMKTDFDARPVYHRLEPRIKAHFLICYTALLIERLMEATLDKQGVHFTARQIIETLQAMNLAGQEGVYLQALYESSDLVDTLCKLYPDLPLDHQYYQPKALNKIIKKISS